MTQFRLALDFDELAPHDAFVIFDAIHIVFVLVHRVEVVDDCKRDRNHLSKQVEHGHLRTAFPFIEQLDDDLFAYDRAVTRNNHRLLVIEEMRDQNDFR